MRLIHGDSWYSLLATPARIYRYNYVTCKRTFESFFIRLCLKLRVVFVLFIRFNFSHWDLTNLYFFACSLENYYSDHHTQLQSLLLKQYLVPHKERNNIDVIPGSVITIMTM